VLSDKLEGIIGQIPIHHSKNDKNDLSKALTSLEQNASIDSSLKTTIQQLVGLITIQDEKLSELLRAMNNYPKKKDLEDLITTISYLSSLIKQLIAKTQK